MCRVFDTRGNGGGAVCPTITGDHQNRVTDYTAIVIQSVSQKSGSSSGNRTENPCHSGQAADRMGGGSEVLVIQKVYDGDRRHADYKCVGEVSPTVTAKYGTGGGNTPIVMQKVTGTLNPGGHPGSYNGQDAYNDLLVVDDGKNNKLCRGG